MHHNTHNEEKKEEQIPGDFLVYNETIYWQHTIISKLQWKIKDRIEQVSSLPTSPSGNGQAGNIKKKAPWTLQKSTWKSDNNERN